MASHICHVDCRIETTPTGGRAHIMYPAEPSSAAGRYQWELNRAILDKGRRAWRESGQGQSRACRVWDERRRTHPNDYLKADRAFNSRRFARELAALSD